MQFPYICFLSHYFIWAEANEETLVLEHDAVFYDRIDKIKYKEDIQNNFNHLNSAEKIEQILNKMRLLLKNNITK